MSELQPADPIDNPSQLCPRCSGEGRIWVPTDPSGNGHWEDPCTTCRGNGLNPALTRGSDA